MMAQQDADRLERLNAMLKRRGIILPAFEIHGGSAGLYDFGPVGGSLLRKVNQAWVNHWLRLGNIVEISSPTVTPHPVLKASGHVGEFSDLITTCNSCEAPSRADHLIEDFHSNADSLETGQISALIAEYSPKCPECGECDWSSVEAQNLMFNTKIGAGKSGRQGYMRPETAQGMFTGFPAIFRHFREKLPFGAIQVGKGYRNEISPRQGMIRLREFNMAELEYFIDPEAEFNHEFSSEDVIGLIPDSAPEFNSTIADAVANGVIRHPLVGRFMELTLQLMIDLGLDVNRMRFRQHESTEMAHYASDCWDLEIHGSYGWIECVGIAHRGCYDLQAHEDATGKSLRAWRAFSEPVQIEKDGWQLDSAVAGPIFKAFSGAVKQHVENLPSDVEFPFNIEIEGTSLTIERDHVKRIQSTETVNGEWFIPHVIEPAFGIDRIMWHILDHGFTELDKDGESYTLLRLDPKIAPIDAAVLPLFNKDGMDDLASLVHHDLLAHANVILDTSGSIGRRYARADEIGVPKCITIDHQSLEDGTVTIRERDTGKQFRTLPENISWQ